MQVDPEADAWVSIGSGLIVFVTFLKGASRDVFPKIGTL
jgi:hypothetical protein